MESPLFKTLEALAYHLGDLVLQLLQLGVHYSLWIVWIAWWLLAVDWRQGWHVLGRGAWMPLILLGVVSAFVWSRIAPYDCPACGLGNFWWQLGYVGMLAGIVLICGWLQGLFRWAPPVLDLNPSHDHGHAEHGHQAEHGHHVEVTEPTHVHDHPHAVHSDH